MADSVGSYRIRWCRVTGVRGCRYIKERMCIAERRNRLMWWPVGEWHYEESAAQRDINYDRELRAPLPETQYV